MSERTAGDSWSGWRDRIVEIPGAGTGTPQLLEFRGGITSGFDLIAVRKGAYHRRARTSVMMVRRRGPSRFVLPANCDALEIQRKRYRNGAGGFSGWKLRVIDRDELPLVSKEDAEGRGIETFGHFADKPYYEYVPALYYDFVDHPGTLIYTPANGGEQVIRHTSYADQKGVLRLPQHGYITVDTDGRWQVSVR